MKKPDHSNRIARTLADWIRAFRAHRHPDADIVNIRLTKPRVGLLSLLPLLQKRQSKRASRSILSRPSSSRTLRHTRGHTQSKLPAFAAISDVIASQIFIRFGIVSPNLRNPSSFSILPNNLNVNTFLQKSLKNFFSLNISKGIRTCFGF